MQHRNVDYAIAALNVIYWFVMVAWFIVLVTDSHRLDGWGSAGFAGPALVAAVGWHRLRSRRKKLQADNGSGTGRRTQPSG
ncbi:hypothetical protein [Arthrobacter sp. MAHUQ-56]